MRRDDLAALLVQPAAGAQLLTGTVVTWDAVNGFVVQAGGAQMEVTVALETLSSLSTGDRVAVLRFKSTVLVLGKTVALVVTSPD